MRARVPALALIGAVVFFGTILSAGAQSTGRMDYDSWQRSLALFQQENPQMNLTWGRGSVSTIYGNRSMGYVPPRLAAEAFVMRYADVFRLSPENLVLQKEHEIEGGRLMAYWFAQTVHGIPVDKGGLTVAVFNNLTSDVVLVISQLRPMPSEEPVGFIGPRRALAVVSRAMRHADYYGNPELVVWGEGEEARYAYKVEASTTDLAKPEKWHFFVDARTGKILEKRDEIYYVDIVGHLDAWRTPGVLPDTSYNPPVLRELPGARARVVGGNSAFANSNGDFVISHPGSSPVTVEAALIGRWVDVRNSAGSNEVLSQTVTPPGPANFVFNQSRTEFVTAQVNAMIHTEVVHDFAIGINPAYPGINITMIANVNINSTCNAYYNGSINFYRSGGGCPNTAYTSVIYHEYGHHIVASGHSSPTGAIHEGMADVTSAFLLNDPVIGRDFRGQNTYVRHLVDQHVNWPCTGGSHTCGLVLGGAYWKTKVNLQNTMGSTEGLNHARKLYLNALLLSPPYSPDWTVAVLTLDDDDGNLNNGTPHYDEINAGFSAHNLPAPPLTWLLFFTNPADLTFMPANTLITFGVRIVDNASRYVPGTGKIHYRINGGQWEERPLISLSSRPLLTNQFQEFATIPAQPPGTLVEWYLSARDHQGRFVTDVNPATPHESLTAVTVTTVLDDNFEQDRGWTVQNVNLQTGAWVRGIPGNWGRGDPPRDADGSGRCYVTGNTQNEDVDGGPTILISPVFSLAGGNGLIELSYWMYNDDGDDSLVLEISNDGGTTWTTVRSWLGGSGGWNRFSFVASRYITPTATMRIRLSVADNPNNSVTEAAIDAVRIRRAS